MRLQEDDQKQLIGEPWSNQRMHSMRVVNFFGKFWMTDAGMGNTNVKAERDIQGCMSKDVRFLCPFS